MNYEKNKRARKIAQYWLNVRAANMCEEINDLYKESPSEFHWKKLYKCTAEYCSIGRLYILRSFNTIIAAFDLDDMVFYDFLRYTYEFTATSTQHLWKFKGKVVEENKELLNDYNYSTIMWREIK